MRSVLLTGDAVGGVWRYSLDLARGLVGRGTSVAFAVLGPAPSASQRDEAAGAGLQLIATGLPLDWTATGADALRAAAAALAGLAHRLRVERVHLHTPALAAHAPWSMPVVSVAHSDVGTWCQTVQGRPPSPDFAWNVEAVAHGLAEADAVIAPSHAFAAMLERLYRPGRRIDVVHNGISAPTSPAIEPRGRAVLVAGRLWDEGKNVALLQRVAASLDCPLRAAGPLAAPGRPPIELPGIETLGVLSANEVTAEMARSTVFASASRYEPFGLAALEAARAGMALALSDIPSHRELWDGAALFFHPEDAGAAHDALRRLLDNPEPMAARARQRAARYTADAMVEGTLAVHRGVGLRRVA